MKFSTFLLYYLQLTFKLLYFVNMNVIVSSCITQRCPNEPGTSKRQECVKCSFQSVCILTFKINLQRIFHGYYIHLSSYYENYLSFTQLKSIDSTESVEFEEWKLLTTVFEEFYRFCRFYRIQLGKTGLYVIKDIYMLIYIFIQGL